MTKIALDAVSGGYNLSTINNNFDLIETELNDKVLYRANPNGEPNAMEQDLDLNGFNVINVNRLSANDVLLDNIPLVDYIEGVAAGTIDVETVDLRRQKYVANSDNITTVTLTRPHTGSEVQILVIRNGVVQDKDQYTVVDDTHISFSQPLFNGEVVEFLYFNTIVGLEGPQGIQGIQGEIGPQGIPGPTGAGVIFGGTANQVLAKVDGVDFNTYWRTLGTAAAEDIGTSGNAVPKLNAINTWSSKQVHTGGSSPIFDIAAGVLGVGKLFDNLGVTVSIPTTKQYNFIRIDNSGATNKFDIAADGVVAGMSFYLESATSSVAPSDLYGVIGALTNKGLGSSKALYGRVISDVALGNTGASSALSLGVSGSANQNFTIGLEMGIDSRAFYGQATGAGAPTHAFRINPQQNTGNDVLGWGLYFAGRLQVNNAWISAHAGGAGDFLRLYDSSGTESAATQLFSVESTGNIHVGETANSTKITSSEITRTAAAGNLSVSSGSSGTLFLGAGAVYPVTVSSTTVAFNKNITQSAYTSLGESAPAIKFKKLTGTTAAAEGGTVNIAHGVTSSKILTIEGLVDAGGGIYARPGHVNNAGYQYDILLGGSNLTVSNHATNSENILSKAIKILISYEE